MQVGTAIPLQIVKEHSMIETSIVIPTYRRPAELERTITSCLAQDAADGTVEIVVVDNDATEPARALTERIAARATPSVRYVVERRPGISNARNTGIAVARGRYIVFIDDDEEAVPGWLAAFLRTIRKSQADLVVGPVRPRFPAGSVAVPAYAKVVFTRDAGLPTDTELESWGALGNAIFDKDRCVFDSVPFDPRFGLTGGEDTVFLYGLLAIGRKLVWCAEAVVHETIPPSKLALGSLLLRAFHGGQITTFVAAMIPAASTVRWGIIRWMAIGSAQVLVCTPAGLLLRIVNDPRWFSLLAKAASGLGKIFWHRRWHLRLYRRETGIEQPAGLSQSG
jgi:glycosyltransferase involved in cell wall biosynthesis